MRSALWVAVSASSIAAAQFSSSTRQQVVAGNNFGIPGQNATYDYVVVGGGTGGLTVAYRLAKDGTKTVAVV